MILYKYFNSLLTQFNIEKLYYCHRLINFKFSDYTVKCELRFKKLNGITISITNNANYFCKQNYKLK